MVPSAEPLSTKDHVLYAYRSVLLDEKLQVRPTVAHQANDGEFVQSVRRFFGTVHVPYLRLEIHFTSCLVSWPGYSQANSVYSSQFRLTSVASLTYISTRTM